MPEVLFKVLCSDSPQACDRVHTTLRESGIQTDYNLKVSTEKGYEHIITTEFETLIKARKKAKELIKKIGFDVVRLDVTINRNKNM